MLTSLQQQSPVRITLESPSGECIAIHRRLRSLLFYSKTKEDGCKFEIFRRETNEIEGNWVRTGFYEHPSRGKCTIIAGAAIEAMGAFLVVLLINKEASVLFLDAFNCSFISISELSSAVLPLCADVDQNRKELTLGFTGGVLVSFAIRQQGEAINNNGKQKGKATENQKSIHALSRKQVKMRQVLKLENKELFSLSQIAHSDITGAVYILSKEGSICCLETGSLECLWIVKRNLFKHCPVYIWVDHFGSEFVVLCSSKENTNVQKNENEKNEKVKKDEKIEGENKMEDGNEEKEEEEEEADDDYEYDDEIQILEYWKPPINHDDAQKGLFNRLQLPLNGKLTSLSIETIHTDLSTMIITISDKNEVQLFLQNEKDESLYIDSTIILSNNFGNKNSNQDFDLENDDIYQHYKNNNKKTFGKFQGVSTYIESTSALPDCPVVFISTKMNEINTLALHIPTLSDILNRRKCLFVAASKVEISILPKQTKTNDEYDDFLEKFHTNNSLLQASQKIFGSKSGISNKSNSSPKNKILQDAEFLQNEHKLLNEKYNFFTDDDNDVLQNDLQNDSFHLGNILMSAARTADQEMVSLASSGFILSPSLDRSASIGDSNNSNTNNNKNNNNFENSNENSLSHLDKYKEGADAVSNNKNENSLFSISFQSIPGQKGGKKDKNEIDRIESELLSFGSDMDDAINTGRSRDGMSRSKDSLSSRLSQSRLSMTKSHPNNL